MNSLTENQLEPGKKSWADNDLLNQLLRSCNLTCPDGSLLLELGPNGWVLQVVGSGGGVPVRITGVHPDSPTGTSDVRIFRGDAYANGSETTASTEDITIRIMGLAANVAEYPTGPGIATPISQSWESDDPDAVAAAQIVLDAAQDDFDAAGTPEEIAAAQIVLDAAQAAFDACETVTEIVYELDPFKWWGVL